MLRYGLLRKVGAASAAWVQRCSVGERATLRRGLRTGRALHRHSASFYSSGVIERARIPITMIARGFKYHETGWWEDHDSGGVTEAEPVEGNPEVYRSLLAYVSDARKEEIYRLHKLEPDIFDAEVLSYLFNLSRTRVAAIIQLKAAEVKRRLQGTLYTEEDDIFDGAPNSSPDKDTAERRKPGVGKSSGPSDPCDLLLLDEESGSETLEDLCRPPGWDPEDKEALFLQAALRQVQHVARLGLTGEEAAAALKPFKEKIDSASLEELVTKLEEQMEKIARRTEEEMYETVHPYEEKGLDQVPDPFNGFRILKRREQAVMEDPDFLQYHAWMGLELERLELLLAHLQLQNQGGGVKGRHPATPYQRKELEHATRLYEERRRECAGMFARLRSVHEARLGHELKGKAEGKEEEQNETGEKELERLVAEETSLLDDVRKRLAPRIVEMEELEEARARVLREIQSLAAIRRRGLLVRGLKADDASERKEKLTEYMEMLLAEAQAAVREEEEESAVSAEDVQWEALQQHRRILRQDSVGQALYKEFGAEVAHAALEQEVVDAILGAREEIVSARPASETPSSRQQQDALKAVMATERESKEREAAMQNYVRSLWGGIRWHSSASDALEATASVSLQAFTRFVGDVHESSGLRGRVDPMEVAAELQGVLANSSSAVSALLSDMVSLAQEGEEGNVSRLAHKEIRAVERGYQENVARELAALKEARVAALKASRGGGAKGGENEALRRYLVLAAVSSRLDAFDRVNQAVLSNLLPEVMRAFRGKQETVAAAYTLLVEEMYGGKAIGATGVAEVAGLARRTEGWVESTLVKILKGSWDEVEKGEIMAQVDVGALASRLLTQDCFYAGIRSSPGLKVLREELLHAARNLDTADVKAVESDFGLSVDTDEVRTMVAGALEKPLKQHIEANIAMADALRRKDAPIRDRARAAKALLDHLRLDVNYQEYAGPVRDRIVEEIEEDLLDTVYDMSDELGMELDPTLVDLKPREHYDIPSLKFRVLNDNEPAVSDRVRDGFIREGPVAEAKGAVNIPVWQPKGDLRDLTEPMDGKGQKGGVQQRRWKFAFKDASVPSAGRGAAKGGTVIRDKTGRLRAASPTEEQGRSWIRRSRKIDLRSDH